MKKENYEQIKKPTANDVMLFIAHNKAIELGYTLVTEEIRTSSSDEFWGNKLLSAATGEKTYTKVVYKLDPKDQLKDAQNYYNHKIEIDLFWKRLRFSINFGGRDHTIPGSAIHLTFLDDGTLTDTQVFGPTDALAKAIHVASEIKSLTGVRSMLWSDTDGKWNLISLDNLRAILSYEIEDSDIDRLFEDGATEYIPKTNGSEARFISMNSIRSQFEFYAKYYQQITDIVLKHDNKEASKFIRMCSL